MSIDRIKNFLSKVVKSDNGRQYTRSFVTYEGSRKLIGGKADTSPLTPEKVQQYIEEFLPVRKEEKDKFGEVFTPQTLINEMLDKLPMNVWSDPTLKWLDPANGIGNFPMVAFVRLDKGLSNVDGFKDKNVRQKHIIQNMLYMVELNPKNVGVSRRIFGKDANIYCGSFLDDAWKRKFGVEKFDVIMGNPPFNASQDYDGKKGGGDSLWDKFVINSIALLKDKAYLVFVHPSAWRKPQSEKSKSKGLFDLMVKDNQIHYLEIHDAVEGKQIFNANTRYDWYVLQKTINNKDTTIKDQKGIFHTLNLNEWHFLPNHSYEIIKKILGNSDNIIFSASQFETRKKWVNKEKTDIFKYPLIHSTTKTQGIKKYYTSTKTPDVKNFIPMFGVSKIIFGDSGIYDAVIDVYGNYGMTQHAMALKIKDEKEGLKIKKVIESRKFKNVLDACSWSNYSIDWRMFKYFKPDWYKIILQKQAKQHQKGGMKRSTRKIYKNILKPQQKTRKRKVQQHKRNTRKNKLVQRRKTRKNKSKRK